MKAGLYLGGVLCPVVKHQVYSTDFEKEANWEESMPVIMALVRLAQEDCYD